jgi:hypothetical protein
MLRYPRIFTIRAVVGSFALVSVANITITLVVRFVALIGGRARWYVGREQGKDVRMIVIGFDMIL